MPKIRDILPFDAEGKLWLKDDAGKKTYVSRDEFTDRANKLLDLDVPEGMPAKYVDRLASMVGGYAPHLTKTASEIRKANRAASSREQAIAEVPDEQRRLDVGRRTLDTANPAGRAVAQTAFGIKEHSPSLDFTNAGSSQDFPEPKGWYEHTARYIGGLAPPVGEGILLGALGVPAFGQFGIPAALERGSVKQRGVRGAVLGLTGSLSGVAAERLVDQPAKKAAESLAARLTTSAIAISQQATAHGFSQQAANVAARSAVEEAAVTNLSRASLARTVKSAAVGAGVFTFVGTPLEQTAYMVTGLPHHFPTPEEYAKNYGLFFATDLALGAMHAPGRIARDLKAAAGKDRLSELPAEPNLPPLPTADDHLKIINEVGASLKEKWANFSDPKINAGRKPFDSYLDRVRAALPQNPTSEEVAAASQRAFGEVNGMMSVHENVQTPAFPEKMPLQIQKDYLRDSQAATAQLKDFVDKFQLSLRSGVPLKSGPFNIDNGVIIDVRVFPWDKQQVRLTIHDTVNNQVIPVKFDNIAEFKAALSEGSRQRVAVFQGANYSPLIVEPSGRIAGLLPPSSTPSEQPSAGGAAPPPPLSGAGSLSVGGEAGAGYHAGTVSIIRLRPGSHNRTIGNETDVSPAIQRLYEEISASTDDATSKAAFDKYVSGRASLAAKTRVSTLALADLVQARVVLNSRLVSLGKITPPEQRLLDLINEHINSVAFNPKGNGTFTPVRGGSGFVVEKHSKVSRAFVKKAANSDLMVGLAPILTKFQDAFQRAAAYHDSISNKKKTDVSVPNPFYSGEFRGFSTDPASFAYYTGRAFDLSSGREGIFMNVWGRMQKAYDEARLIGYPGHEFPVVLAMEIAGTLAHETVHAKFKDHDAGSFGWGQKYVLMYASYEQSLMINELVEFFSKDGGKNLRELIDQTHEYSAAVKIMGAFDAKAVNEFLYGPAGPVPVGVPVAGGEAAGSAPPAPVGVPAGSAGAGTGHGGTGANAAPSKAAVSTANKGGAPFTVRRAVKGTKDVGHTVVYRGALAGSIEGDHFTLAAYGPIKSTIINQDHPSGVDVPTRYLKIVENKDALTIDQLNEVYSNRVGGRSSADAAQEPKKLFRSIGIYNRNTKVIHEGRPGEIHATLNERISLETGAHWDDFEDGFITQDGIFLDRYQAEELASGGKHGFGESYNMYDAGKLEVAPGAYAQEQRNVIRNNLARLRMEAIEKQGASPRSATPMRTQTTVRKVNDLYVKNFGANAERPFDRAAMHDGDTLWIGKHGESHDELFERISAQHATKTLDAGDVVFGMMHKNGSFYDTDGALDYANDPTTLPRSEYMHARIVRHDRASGKSYRTLDELNSDYDGHSLSESVQEPKKLFKSIGIFDTKTNTIHPGLLGEIHAVTTDRIAREIEKRGEDPWEENRFVDGFIDQHGNFFDRDQAEDLVDGKISGESYSMYRAGLLETSPSLFGTLRTNSEKAAQQAADDASRERARLWRVADLAAREREKENNLEDAAYGSAKSAALESLGPEKPTQDATTNNKHAGAEKKIIVDKASELADAVGKNPAGVALLSEIRDKLKNQPEEPPVVGLSEHSPGRSIFGDGPIGIAFGDAVLKNTKRAQEKLQRQNGKKANSLDIVDNKGNVVMREPIGDKDFSDPWSDFWSLRQLARFGIGGAHVILPPKVRQRAYAAKAQEAALYSGIMRQLHETLGDEGLSLLRPYGKLDFAFFDLFDGEATNIRQSSGSTKFTGADGAEHEMPTWLYNKAPDVRRILDELHGMAQGEAKRRGVKGPRFIKDYISHITMGMNPEKFRAHMEFLNDGPINESRIKELRNRFYEQRKGDPNFRRSFFEAFNAYTTAFSKKYAWDTVLDDIVAFGRSEEAFTPAGKERWDSMKMWTQGHLLKQKSHAETLMDGGLRKLFFTRFGSGVREIDEATTKRWLGKESTKDIKFTVKTKKGKEVALPAQNYFYVEPKRNVNIEGIEAKLVGVTSGGGKIYATAGATLYGHEHPVIRRWADVAFRAVGEFESRMSKGMDVDEEAVRRAILHQDKISRMERDPTNILVSWWTNRQLKALLGYNLRSSFVNSAQVVMHTLPEFGFRPFVEGTGAWSKALWQKSLRGKVDVLEKAGFLTKQEADTRREAIPLLMEEILAQSVGSKPGEAQILHNELKRIQRGWDKMEDKLTELTSSLGAYGLAESFNRGWDANIIWANGKRLGLSDDGIAKAYLSTQKAKQDAMLDIIGKISDKKSAASYLAINPAVTQFHYDLMGQPTYMAGPLGRMFGQLTNFSVNYFLHQELRPLEGALRSGAAAVKRSLGEVSPLTEIGYKSPKNAFEKYLAEGGANYEQRHAAAVFGRRMLLSGALLAAAEATKINFMVFGTPLPMLMMLRAVSALFPDDEKFKRWYKYGESGAVIGTSKGLGFVGPTVSLMYDFDPREMQFRAWVLNVLRRMLVPADVEIRRVIRENPDWVRENAPFLFSVFDVRSTIPGLSAGEKVKHHLGLMDPTEETRKMRKARGKETMQPSSGL